MIIRRTYKEGEPTVFDADGNVLEQKRPKLEITSMEFCCSGALSVLLEHAFLRKGRKGSPCGVAEQKIGLVSMGTLEFCPRCGAKVEYIDTHPEKN